jgi:hydrogenase maturation protease
VSSTVILGIGNVLLQDEGVGVHAVQQLEQRYDMPAEVRVLDGGTMGLDLLPFLEEAERLLIIDAVDAEHPPGTIIRLVNDDVPSVLQHKLSPHHVGVADMLAAARLQGCLPGQVVLIGIQPHSLEVGMELSSTLSARMPDILRAIITELQSWGLCTNLQ